jgi:transcriptional regulator with XRE-family HTH domain
MMNPRWFAGRLKELREASGWTQQQLADAAGLKLGGIRDLEQQRTGPTWETVLALCEALGVSCESFTEEPESDAKQSRGRPRKTASTDSGLSPPKPPPSAAPKRKTQRKGK